MRESRSYGSVRGALSNERPYREWTECIKHLPVKFIDQNRGAA